MKLLRFGAVGAERPGILASDGVIRDLSSVIADIDGPALSAEGLEILHRVDILSLPKVPQDVRIGPCVANPSKFICIGLNYADHAAESNLPIPEEPIVFQKAVSAICGPNDDVIMPKTATSLDWEVELGLVIGKRARNVSIQEASEHIAGYCVVHDVSERSYQTNRGGQWTKGKSADTFGPIGPWLVTTDEVTDVGNLDMFLKVDGVTRQSGSTRTMIFRPDFLVSYVSEFMTLVPGDIVATGTPPGVGLGMKPPVYLSVGQSIHLGIEGLGEQRQTVVAYS